MVYLYQTEQTIYASESYDSVIRKINYKNGIVIYLNSDYQDVLESSSLLNIPFKNQSKVQLINEAFSIYTRGEKIYSTLNSESRKVFFDFHKGPFVFSRYYPDEDANLTAVDLNKCYSSCLTNGNQEDWPIFTAFDEITEFKGRLKPGFFYVETDNFFPLKLNGWYSCAILKYCQHEGIEFKVKYELVPSYTLPKDYFCELVDRVYDKLGDDRAKFLINALIYNKVLFKRPLGVKVL